MPRTIVGVVDTARRAASSRNGNPAYALTVDGVEYRTAPDAAIAYGLPNLLGPTLDRRPRLFLTLDGRGRIIDATECL